MVGKCKYNPAINCEIRDCRQCGWSAVVKTARLEKIKSHLPKRPTRVIDIDKFGDWLRKTHPNNKTAGKLVEEYWRGWSTE